MLHLLPTIRQYGYLVFALWCLLTFIISAAFVGTSEKDVGFYWDGAALLLASSILGFGVLGLHFLVHRRGNTSIVGSLLVETVAVWILWVLFLSGAAHLSGNIYTGSCSGNLCNLARATQAFGWLAWITLTVLYIVLVWTGIAATMKCKNSSAVWKAPFGADHGEAAAKSNGGTAAPTTTTANAEAAPVGTAPMAQV